MRRTKLTLRFDRAQTREVTAWMPDDVDNGLRAHRSQAENGDGKGWVVSTRGGLRVAGVWFRRDDALTAVEALTGVIPMELVDNEFAAGTRELRDQVIDTLQQCCIYPPLPVEDTLPEEGEAA